MKLTINTDLDKVKIKDKKGSVMDYGIVGSIVAFVASVATMWGMLQQKVHQLEDRIAVVEKDHDILVEIRTKIDLLLDNRIETGAKKQKRV